MSLGSVFWLAVDVDAAHAREYSFGEGGAVELDAFVRLHAREGEEGGEKTRN
jgi:hypothetical protein